MTKIEPQFIHCCYNNCIAYTGQYAEETECPHCEETRYITNTSKPRKHFVYIPLIDRLKLQYGNPIRAKVLTKYRENLLRREKGELADFFNGKLFSEFHVRELGLFEDPCDIALHMSLDGVQLTNMRNHEVTPVILINLNLPPEERYQVKNILGSLIIPGPKKPRDLDTFLRPLVDELLRLDEGVDAFDSYTKTPFRLKAWVTMVTGDGPALADAIGMKRPGNAFRPCRACEIKAERCGGNTYYVPHSNYNFGNPPLREDLRGMIRMVEEADSDEERKWTGISRSSILLELRSLHFPRSFPADIMHLVLQNIAPTLYKLWSRTKLPMDDRTNSNFTRESYHLDDASIAEVSAALVEARENIPTYLSHTPRRIDRHHNGYKAAEWEAWVKLFGIPLLDQRLDDSCVDNFRLLSCIYLLSTQFSLKHSDVDILDDLVIRFVRSYEELYYGHNPQRVSVCSVNIHYLLHLPSYIRDCGPARYWWQFPMERFCGILKPKARSKSQLNYSVSNELVIMEHLNHVQLSRLRSPTLPASYLVLMDNYEATLSSQQRLRLVREYEIINVRFYKRCKIREGFVVGSVKSQRRGDITRSSCKVCYSQPQQLQMGFGIVQYFIEAVDKYQQLHRLAWVQKLRDIDIDHSKRICSYGSEGGHCWIEAEQIQSLIGIIQEGGVKFIVTDVNLFDFR